MAFVFDSTVSGASANSYPSVVQAADYQLSNLNRETWEDEETVDKQAALVMATRLLDDQMIWDGVKSTTAQKLRWPRYGVYTKDGESVLSTIIPDAVLNAVSELAWWLKASDRITDAEGDTVSKMKLDTLEMEFTEGSKTKIIPDHVFDMVREYGTMAGVGNTVMILR